MRRVIGEHRKTAGHGDWEQREMGPDCSASHGGRKGGRREAALR